MSPKFLVHSSIGLQICVKLTKNWLIKLEIAKDNADTEIQIYQYKDIKKAVYPKS